MGIFATRGRPAPSAHPEAKVDLPNELRAALPPRFEAVGEALASGWGTVDACAVVGRNLALDGVSLDEALDGLGTTCGLVRGTEPDFAATRALSVAWSEATLGYLHHLSCEDPATGLASLAHLQCRLSELYRGQLRGRHPARDSHALVVIDLAPVAAPASAPSGAFEADLHAARFAETARTVFCGAETIGRLGGHRLVVLADRDEELGRRVALVRRMLTRLDPAGRDARAWIEGLPPTDEGATSLLGELARR